MNRPGYAEIQAGLRATPCTWVVTGIAGFIGSNLGLRLLELGQRVVGLDNFSTGRKENIAELQQYDAATGRFLFHEGDIRDAGILGEVCRGADYVLHQAALGSVPRSIKDPITTTEVNLGGTLNVFSAARAAGVRRVVYASSSSVYGDTAVFPMSEESLGSQLSPYAVSKRCVELYAGVWKRSFGLESVGLRYFNVFGPRQSPLGPYSAVIPLWISALMNGRQCLIYGDGLTSRDFCFIENIVRANLLAALAPLEAERSNVFNIGCGEELSLKVLHETLVSEVSCLRSGDIKIQTAPGYEPSRAGDLPRSRADISAARRILGYAPEILAREGLRLTVNWFAKG